MSTHALIEGTLSKHVMAQGRGIVSMHALSRVTISRHAIGQGALSRHDMELSRGTVSRHVLGRVTVSRHALSQGTLSKHVIELGRGTMLRQVALAWSTMSKQELGRRTLYMYVMALG